MQWLRLRKSLQFVDLVILAGAICLCAPLIWSIRSNILQSKERTAWNAASIIDEVQKTGQNKIRLIIPKIKLDAIVVEGIQNSDLDRGPMHIIGTSPPGRPGNCCIAGHKEKWFRKLGKLTTGDSAILQTKKRSYIYVMVNKLVVSGNDISALEDSGQANLVLITCTGPPYMHSDGRLLVFCRLNAVK
jgi:sortase A